MIWALGKEGLSRKRASRRGDLEINVISNVYLVIYVVESRCLAESGGADH